MSSQHDQQEIERLRASLQQRLQRAPEWINGASVQAVRDWKKNYEQARKTLNRKNATASALQSAINSVS